MCDEILKKSETKSFEHLPKVSSFIEISAAPAIVIAPTTRLKI